MSNRKYIYSTYLSYTKITIFRVSKKIYIVKVSNEELKIKKVK